VAEAKAALGKIRELATVPDYLLDQGIPEPVAAAASLMLRDEAQREMFMVVDVGAGTTDFGVFLLQHNPDRDVCLTRIIPGTIEYLPEAGNRVDDLLKFFVLDSEGIDPGSVEGKHNKTYLDSRIRIYKETLFRDGIVEVTLANHSRVLVDREEFLKSNRVQHFAQRLRDKLEMVLAVLGDGYLDLLARSDLKVVLTGGGASLPMVTDLAKGLVEIKGRKIMRNPTPIVPAWIDETYPQFSPQYPQLAVAIGGAAPALPQQGESFADFKGLGAQTYA
jgi:molecular chaperone HscA